MTGCHCILVLEEARILSLSLQYSLRTTPRATTITIDETSRSETEVGDRKIGSKTWKAPAGGVDGVLELPACTKAYSSRSNDSNREHALLDRRFNSIACISILYRRQRRCSRFELLLGPLFRCENRGDRNISYRCRRREIVVMLMASWNRSTEGGGGAFPLPIADGRAFATMLHDGRAFATLLQILQHLAICNNVAKFATFGDRTNNTKEFALPRGYTF